jgi:hypothetical protein
MIWARESGVNEHTITFLNYSDNQYGQQEYPLTAVEELVPNKNRNSRSQRTRRVGIEPSYENRRSYRNLNIVFTTLRGRWSAT